MIASSPDPEGQLRRRLACLSLTHRSEGPRSPRAHLLRERRETRSRATLPDAERPAGGQGASLTVPLRTQGLQRGAAGVLERT